MSLFILIDLIKMRTALRNKYLAPPGYSGSAQAEHKPVIGNSFASVPTKYWSDHIDKFKVISFSLKAAISTHVPFSAPEGGGDERGWAHAYPPRRMMTRNRVKSNKVKPKSKASRCWSCSQQGFKRTSNPVRNTLLGDKGPCWSQARKRLNNLWVEVEVLPAWILMHDACVSLWNCWNTNSHHASDSSAK